MFHLLSSTEECEGVFTPGSSLTLVQTKHNDFSNNGRLVTSDKHRTAGHCNAFFFLSINKSCIRASGVCYSMADGCLAKADTTCAQLNSKDARLSANVLDRGQTTFTPYP